MPTIPIIPEKSDFFVLLGQELFLLFIKTVNASKTLPIDAAKKNKTQVQRSAIEVI